MFFPQRTGRRMMNKKLFRIRKGFFCARREERDRPEDGSAENRKILFRTVSFNRGEDRRDLHVGSTEYKTVVYD